MSRIIRAGDDGYDTLSALEGRTRPYDDVYWQIVSDPAGDFFVEISKVTERSSFNQPMSGWHGVYPPDESVLPDPDMDEWWW